MIFDPDCTIGQIEHLRIGQAKSFAVRLGCPQVLCAGVAVPAGIDQPHLLAAERAAQHRAVSLPESRFVDVELVGIDLALHDVFAETPGPGDENHITEAGFGVEGEDDPARREIGAHHLHHPDRQGDLEMVEAVVDAIDDGAVGEDRRKAAPAGFDHVGLAAHIQKALMLTGEACGRQVLGGRRAAHRDRDAGAAFPFERVIGSGDLFAQPGVAGRLVNDLSCGRGPLSEKRHIVMVEIREQSAQLLPGLGFAERVAVGRRSQREPFRDPGAEQ